MLANRELGFCGLIDRETLLNEIMTSVEDLVSDPSQHVRAALGTQISGLAPLLGKEELVDITYCFVCPRLLTIYSGLLPISFQCSSKCSRTNTPMSVCISFPNWSMSIRVRKPDFQFKLILISDHYSYRH